MEEALIILNQGWQAWGWYGLAIAGVVVAIRSFRRPLIQSALGGTTSKLRWLNWPAGLRKAFVFVASLGATFLTALGTGQGIIAALVAAVPVAVASIVAHKITKAIGHAHTRAALTRGLNYKPKGIRTSLDFMGVLPIDHHTINEINLRLKDATDKKKSQSPAK